MTAVAGYGLSKLLLVDAGWPLEEVGKVGMAGGMITVLLGIVCALLAMWLARQLAQQSQLA